MLAAVEVCRPVEAQAGDDDPHRVIEKDDPDEQTATRAFDCSDARLPKKRANRKAGLASLPSAGYLRGSDFRC